MEQLGSLSLPYDQKRKNIRKEISVLIHIRCAEEETLIILLSKSTADESYVGKPDNALTNEHTETRERYPHTKVRTPDMEIADMMEEKITNVGSNFQAKFGRL